LGAPGKGAEFSAAPAGSAPQAATQPPPAPPAEDDDDVPF